ncbi:hypothetical protein SAMN05443551_1021 [Marivita hallyeonensis]|uniref:Uncharacterized protein n=1 Tax=Marivita hallyeonensis TaxID=996342 RepID=A0A1M5NRP1_9RHOB|nr:hypothetical protein SAMN05443551_1021 [Marivita hallyeonensis]
MALPGIGTGGDDLTGTESRATRPAVPAPDRPDGPALLNALRIAEPVECLTPIKLGRSAVGAPTPGPALARLGQRFPLPLPGDLVTHILFDKRGAR